MVRIVVETMISAPIERCFDLARSLSTHVATTGRTRERVVSDHESDLVGLGDSITFEATHLGVRQRLTSRIVEFDRPNGFTDEMVRGAFRSLRHEHRFESLADERTKMSDILEFELPMGPIGRVFDLLVLRGYMERFIRDRGVDLKAIAESE